MPLTKKEESRNLCQTHRFIGQVRDCYEFSDLVKALRSYVFIGLSKPPFLHVNISPIVYNGYDKTINWCSCEI